MNFMGSLQKKIASIALLIFITIGYGSFIKPMPVDAATKYVTRGDMIQMILDELHETYDEFSTTDYITTAQRVGLINEKTFTNYDAYANKAEVAMLLVRADEYLYGKTVSSDLVKKITECRISDIAKVRKGYRTHLAKAFALGYIMGNSNGVYSTNRKFNPNNKVTISYAKQLVNKIRDKESRHQVSPDGQLIRTTKLPKMAEFYPYILASYPNSYYDWQFMFMRTQINDKPVYGTDQWVSKRDYASPADFKDYENGKDVFVYYFSRDMYSAKKLYDICADAWEENTRSYLECVFNVNYKTLEKDKKWMEKLLQADFNGVNDTENTREGIENYIKRAIENKTVIESSVIAVDKSTVYESDGFIYIRAYVKYRVNSAENLECVPLSPLFYTNYTFASIDNVELGEWREGYINVQVTGASPNYGVRSAIIDDEFHNKWVVDLCDITKR